jgi:hypothetical protein
LNLLSKLVDGVEVDMGVVGSAQHRVGHHFELEVVVSELGNVEAVLLGELGQRFSVWMLSQQKPGGRVVDSRRDTDIHPLGRALGLILEASGLHGVRARADEAKARLFDRTDELFVLRHEAVAREDVIVPVVFRDPNDFGDALGPLFLARARVVGNRVNSGRVQSPELRRQRPGIHDRVLLREKDSDLRHPHLAEDVERLLPDRAAAHDENRHVLAAE